MKAGNQEGWEIKKLRIRKGLNQDSWEGKSRELGEPLQLLHLQVSGLVFRKNAFYFL